jgi:hypothetical protein
MPTVQEITWSIKWLHLTPDLIERGSRSCRIRTITMAYFTNEYSFNYFTDKLGSELFTFTFWRLFIPCIFSCSSYLTVCRSHGKERRHLLQFAIIFCLDNLGINILASKLKSSVSIQTRILWLVSYSPYRKWLRWVFIQSELCLTTGSKPLPKRALHIVRSRASSFRCKYPLRSLRLSRTFLCLILRLSVTSIPSFIFRSIICRRRQFLCKMWPTQLRWLYDIKINFWFS